jgi:hypothetical protein
MNVYSGEVNQVKQGDIVTEYSGSVMLKTREQAVKDILERRAAVSSSVGASSSGASETVPKDTSPHVGGKTKKAERDPSIFYAGRHKRECNQKQVIDALIAADGALTIAAKRLGTSYRHLKKYIDANEKLTEVLHGIEETNLDAAESTLFAAIREGNLTATIFYLKTKARGGGTRNTISRTPANPCSP